MSSDFLVSTEKYPRDPQKISKNIAIQDFLRNLPVLSKLQKTNNDTQLFTHNKSPHCSTTHPLELSMKNY